MLDGRGPIGASNFSREISILAIFRPKAWRIPAQAKRSAGLGCEADGFCTPKVCRKARWFLHTFGVRRRGRPNTQGGAALALGWFPELQTML
jgi:hypothetical protein